MYRLKMFGWWAVDKITEPFKGDSVYAEIHREIFLVGCYAYTVIGSAFWFMDTVWFLLLPFRIVWCFAALITCIHLFNAINRFIRNQYNDYQAFVISGGKQKRKNEDETAQ